MTFAPPVRLIHETHPSGSLALAPMRSGRMGVAARALEQKRVRPEQSCACEFAPHPAAAPSALSRRGREKQPPAWSLQRSKTTSTTKTVVLKVYQWFFVRGQKRPEMVSSGWQVFESKDAPKAKFWLEPRIELAQNHGLNARQINTALKIVEDHADEIRKAWKAHFGS